MKYLSLLSALILLTPFSAKLALADASVDNLVERANDASAAVESLAGSNAAPDSAVPKALLKQAVCIVSIPNYKKAGFIFGGSYGAGLASCRDRSGQFETPYFMMLVGGSWGLQIGGSSTNLMLVMTEANAKDELTKNLGIKFGAGVSVAAGPVGRDLEVGTDADFNEKTLSYSTSRGIFAGLTLNGAKLSQDHKAQYQDTDPRVANAMVNFQQTLNALLDERNP